MSLLARYRSVLAPVRWPVLGYLLSGAAVSLKPLAAVFLLREQGIAYGVVGLVLAAEVFGAAVGLLTQGRLTDRLGARRVLPPMIVLHIAALVIFAIAVGRDWPIAVIIVATVGWGSTQPVLLPSLRAAWGTVHSGEQRDLAYSLQAVMTEAVFVAGPLLASGVALAFGATTAIGLAIVLTGAGATLFAITIVGRPVTAEQVREARERGRFAAIRTVQMRTLVGAATLSGITAGSIEILLPVFAERSGSTTQAGIGFAVLALGSILGGVAYGAHSWRSALGSRMTAFTALLAVALLPLIATPGFAVVCGLLFLGGMTLAPAEACLYTLIDDVADDAMIVEANSWVTALYTAGLGIGAGIGGQLVSNATLPAAAAVPAGATIVAAALIRTGIRRPAGQPEHQEHAAPLAAT